MCVCVYAYVATRGIASEPRYISYDILRRRARHNTMGNIEIDTFRVITIIIVINIAVVGGRTTQRCIEILYYYYHACARVRLHTGH